MKLESVYDLCVIGASPDAFKNGVTDSTGTIDEGDVRASQILDDLKKLIEQMLNGEVIILALTDREEAMVTDRDRDGDDIIRLVLARVPELSADEIAAAFASQALNANASVMAEIADAVAAPSRRSRSG